MWGLQHVWAYLIGLVLVLSPNARNAVVAHGHNLKQVVRGVALHTWNLGRRWIAVTDWLFCLALVLLLVGQFWQPLKVVAPMLLILWFGVTVLILRGVGNALSAVGKIGPFKWNDTTIIPEIPIDKIGDALGNALKLGAKPILWVLAVLAMIGLRPLAFPGLNGVIGLLVSLFGFFGFVGWTAANAYQGKPAGTLRMLKLFIVIALVAFTIRLIPNANSFVVEHTRVLFGRLGSSASTRSVKNEPFARFTADRYLMQLGLADKTNVPIFDAKGQPLGTDVKQALLGEIDDGLVILLDAKTKPPKGMKLAGIEFAKIQNPAGAMGQYIVPRRCIDPESKDPFRAAIEKMKEDTYKLAPAQIAQSLNPGADAIELQPGTDFGFFPKPVSAGTAIKVGSGTNVGLRAYIVERVETDRTKVLVLESFPFYHPYLTRSSGWLMVAPDVGQNIHLASPLGVEVERVE